MNGRHGDQAAWLAITVLLLLVAAWAVGYVARHDIGRGWLY